MVDGDVDPGALSCGMVVGLINDIPTVKELIDRIMAEAEQIIRGRLTGFLDTIAPSRSRLEQVAAEVVGGGPRRAAATHRNHRQSSDHPPRLLRHRRPARSQVLNRR
jgi:hypothetical protein